MAVKPHIKFSGHFENLQYTYPRTVVITSKSIPLIREWSSHGNYLLNKVNEIKDTLDNFNQTVDLTLISEEIVYVEFTSEWGYELSFDSFDTSGFHLLNIKKETRIQYESEEYRYILVVLVNEKAIASFIRKIKSYLNGTRFKKDKITGEKLDTGVRNNHNLLNNISDIEVATLKAFWVDSPEIPFPNENESIWWEVWFRKTDNPNHLSEALTNLELVECIIGNATLDLTDHLIKLVKGTSGQLSKALLLIGNLAELRSPSQIADFILHSDITLSTKQEYLQDLLDRIDFKNDDNSVVVCLLDSGVNNLHPLINQFLPSENLYTYNESWGVQDSHPSDGHGTGVAGLVLYGDLSELLGTSHRISINYGLESYKVYHHASSNDPELDGDIFKSATSTPVIYKPNNLRIFCLTVTRKNLFKGRPSSASGAIDEICFGKNDDPQLFIISGGNIGINNHNDFPLLNWQEAVQDPAQAYNAITIGTYTRKDKLNDVLNGLGPLVNSGTMAPSNSTSLEFESHWPNKPDVVFEGGNLATDGTYTQQHENLDVISLHKDYSDYRNNIFTNFGQTSGAAGIASKMAAEIRSQYPDLWPETVRALIIHSANWTKAMLDSEDLKYLTKPQKYRRLLRTVGYGVPSLEKAIFSANNSLTLIAERTIKPYKKSGSNGAYDKFHLFTLPWPAEALESLEAQDVTLKVTLSYYIEPNAGSRKFSNHYQYHSHQLDFELINRNEDISTFTSRISKPENETKDNKVKRTGVSWSIGNSSSKGSIRKDFITLSGREMSERNCLAVFPRNGWYKNLKRQNKFNQKVRYSLIINIETDETAVDLYTPVINQIAVNV